MCFGSEILPQKNCCVVKCRVELSICLLVFAALEKKLLSHICENGERHLFSSIPSSGLPPGIPEVSSNAREPPYRTDTDTPTFTGDFRRVQKMVKTCWFFLTLFCALRLCCNIERTLKSSSQFGDFFSSANSRSDFSLFR